MQQSAALRGRGRCPRGRGRGGCSAPAGPSWSARSGSAGRRGRGGEVLDYQGDELSAPQPDGEAEQQRAVAQPSVGCGVDAVDQLEPWVAQQPVALPAAVVELVDEVQLPVPTTAVRMILSDKGRAVTAEQLGALAAYERNDYARTRIPPRLCSAIDADAQALVPRWWARGDWRLERRIITADSKPIALTGIAIHLCRHLADQAGRANPTLVSYTLGLANQLLRLRYFETPLSHDDWMDLHRQLYAPYNGALNNLGGFTADQREAAERLRAHNLPALGLIFGRDAD